MPIATSLATAFALVQLAAILVRHCPKACTVLLAAAHRVAEAKTPAEEVRAVLIGLEEAANEARDILKDLTPPQGK